jgi:elongation factor Ts
MAITAAMIKELRERTGAGMMDCKKALTEVNGDMDAAIEGLRIKGAAAAEKKSGRIAAEGVIVSAQSESASVMVEINCETDFVAKDSSFQEFSASIANTVLERSPESNESLASAMQENGSTVEAARQELITKIGENISIRRFARLEADGGIVSCYLHGARIGVLVKLSGGSDELGRDIAMHIAASKPLCVSEQEMDSSVLEKEKEIFVAQARDSGKPADIIEKMVGGRIKKFLKENTLLGQPFVKNPDQTVGQLVQDAGVTIIQMVRFEVGEGLEKRSEDFVSEVMAQVGG